MFCGECLAERGRVQPLAEGVCPDCGADYRIDVATLQGLYCCQCGHLMGFDGDGLRCLRCEPGGEAEVRVEVTL
jgi:hypothetical protein